jgi:GT2 family glycosyltransferase
MREVDVNHYKLALLTARRLPLIRLDPAEFECLFQIRAFSATPISVSAFLARAMRNGENRTPENASHPRHLGRIFRELKNRGVAFETGRTQGRAARDASYSAWIRRFEEPAATPGLVTERCRSLRNPPLISVLMPVFDTPKDLLDLAIRSVVQQLYANWELCIADDASSKPWMRPLLEAWQQQDQRIRVVFRESNGHISEATNSAFSMARGEWIALLDHDDVLAPNALAEVACAIENHPDAEIIYSDEDKIDDVGKRFNPFFKPDWSYDLFTGQNYLNHLTVHRAANIRRVGGWRIGFEGSQDYDLTLRIIEATGQDGIIHIPKVLYHWRAARGSAAGDKTAKNYAHHAGRRALAEHAARTGIDAEVLSVGEEQYYRLKRAIPADPPLVSIIIPTRDKVDILRTCVGSVLNKTKYPRFEILIVDNHSTDPDTIEYLTTVTRLANVKVLRYEKQFNYSSINNFAVRQAAGHIVCLMNNDIEVINGGWLTELVAHAVRPTIGCVGAKLYYPDDTLQHAGVILGLGGVAGHSHKHYKRSEGGYYGRLMLVQNLSAVTAACMAVRKSVYLEAGGLDEENLAIAFNDVDFCLRVRKLGYLNVWTPFAELYHHESASRGSDSAPGAVKRFQEEIFYMKRRWGKELRADAYYSINLTRDREDFSLAG